MPKPWACAGIVRQRRASRDIARGQAPRQRPRGRRPIRRRRIVAYGLCYATLG